MLLAAAVWTLLASFPQGKLYRSEEEGARVVALRAEGRLAAPPWAVRKVLSTVWLYPGVAPYLVERRVLAADRCQDGARDLPGCRRVWAYERYSPPVVVDRDYVFRVEIATDELDAGGDFEIAWELDPSRGPPPPQDVVRMRRNTGAWRLSPDGDGTRFSYRISADPGGDLPAWVVNAANERQVPSVISSLEESARKLAAAASR
jgi:hypothetical protein